MKTSSRLLIAHLRSLAEQGMTLAQAATDVEMGYGYLSLLAGRHDICFPRQRMSDRPEAKQRAADMRLRYENGETLEAIGARYGVTRERVRQILTGRFGTRAKDGGQSEISRRKRREFQKKRDGRSMRMWGCCYRDYHRILKHPDKPTYAYWAQRKNAIHRKIGWELNLWQWWRLWEQSGHWNERGNGKGYCMCRLNDVGPYAVDNVYIATGTDNMKDHWVNKRASETVAA